MKKYIHLINIMVALTLLMAGLFAANFLLFNDIKNKNENISQLSAYLSSEISREDYAASTQKQLQDLGEDISKVRNSIVSKAGDVEFIENLEAVAYRNNLSIDIDSIMIENDPKISSSTVTLLKIRATTEGSWSNTYKFLNQLESLPYKIKLNSTSLSRMDATIGKKILWTSVSEIRVLKYK